MINWDELPPISNDKLRYNKELVRAQLKVLFIGNLLFGILSMSTVFIGLYVMNDAHLEDTTKAHLFCVNHWEWINNDIWGMLFITLHQMLILLQINLSQYVMVRIPWNQGVFEEDRIHDFQSSLRSKLAV